MWENLKLKKYMLDVYYKMGSENSEVYEDAQDGYDYTKGEYSLRNFKLTGKENELIIQQFKDGNFITSYETFKLNLMGLPFKIKAIQLDNETIALKDVKMNGNNTIHVTKDFTTLHILGK